MKASPEELEIAINGCIAGDRRCQEEVFRMFFGKMIGVCMRYTRDKDTAQEMCQEAFIKAFDKMVDFNFTGSFEGWLRRIVVNTAIDYFRKNKNTVLIEDDSLIGSEEEESDFDDESSSAYENIKPEMVLAAMQKLSPAYQTVFNLYVYENHTHKEISEMLGISIGTSKSNLSKAKLKLKKLLEKHLTYK